MTPLPHPLDETVPLMTVKGMRSEYLLARLVVEASGGEVAVGVEVVVQVSGSTEALCEGGETE